MKMTLKVVKNHKIQIMDPKVHAKKILLRLLRLIKLQNQVEVLKNIKMNLNVKVKQLELSISVI